MTSATSVEINFKDMEMVILGTEYAGEMKKGIFTVMFYLMPIKHKVLTLHSSCNQGVEKVMSLCSLVFLVLVRPLCLLIHKES